MEGKKYSGEQQRRSINKSIRKEKPNMRHTLKKNRVLSILLAATLILTLFPVTALAANAVGTAGGTQGYSDVFVNLSGAEPGEFSTDETAVENPANWTLNVTGGSQTISNVTRTGVRSVTIRLSAPIATGNTFTLNALADVFAAGTEPFAAPIPVNITVPNPATGTAIATAGTKDISVALTYGSFTSATNVENKLLWTLGGASAAGNPIAGVTRVDSTHATVSLTNNIGASDVYTITAMQPVFVNMAVAPFVSPLLVTISGGDTTPPAFAPGYPIAGAMQENGSRQVRVVFHAQEEACYDFVLLPDGAAAPTKEQVRNGLDAAGSPALKAVSSGNFKTDEIDAGTFGQRHNTEYDIYIILRDDAGNLSEPAKVDVKTPPASDFFVSGYPKLGAVQPQGSKNIQILVNMQNTQTNAMIYYVLVADGAGEPSINQIANGQDSTGAAALAFGTDTFAKGTEHSFLVTGLADGTAYDLYLFSGDTYYGIPYITSTEVFKVDVTTPVAAEEPADPVVATNAASSVTASSAQLSGSVAYSGSGSITERGFVYATHAGPTTGVDTKILTGNGTGSFSASLTGLSAANTYYVRAYAIYSGEVVYYGNEISFTTSYAYNPPGRYEDGPPTVVTVAVSGVTTTGAALSGNVTSDGGTTVTERGFVYSTSAHPMLLSGTKVLAGSGMGSFTAVLTNLAADCTYYVRAYAINNRGTAYGAAISFATAAVVDVEALNDIPNTGDSSQSLVWWLLCGASAVGIAMVVLFGKKSIYKH